METRNYSESVNKGFERLGAHIVSKREVLPGETERTIIKESVRSLSNEVNQNIPSPSVSAPQNDGSVHVIPEYAEVESADVKKEIERIVEVAANQGIEAGIRESLRHPAFVQDAFHDALVDILVPELKKRGILE